MLESLIVEEKLSPEEILEALPTSSPFRFADRLIEVTDDYAIGCYRFKEEEFFYQGHFKGFAITPGAILLETLGQAGIIPLGIHLGAKHAETRSLIPVLSHSELELSHPVYPGDEVVVRADKIYFRKNLLKCKATMKVGDNLAAQAVVSVKFTNPKSLQN